MPQPHPWTEYSLTEVKLILKCAWFPRDFTHKLALTHRAAGIAAYKPSFSLLFQGSSLALWSSSHRAEGNCLLMNIKSVLPTVLKLHQNWCTSVLAIKRREETGPWCQLVTYNMEDDLSTVTDKSPFTISFRGIIHFFLRFRSIFGGHKNTQGVASHFYSSAGTLYTEDIIFGSCLNFCIFFLQVRTKPWQKIMLSR